MKRLYLLKLGELMLKKGNRKVFERQLKQAIQYGLEDAQVQMRNGRFYVQSEQEVCVIEERLRHLCGITGFAAVQSCEKQDEQICKAAIALAQVMSEQCGASSSFRVTVRRTDKSLARNSQEYAVWLGSELIQAMPQLRVDLHQPDWQIFLELREKAYLYLQSIRAASGLPFASGGQGMLLLSGGIDSPVGGYLMAKRGMAIEAIYFDTPPFTTEAAFDKVQRLAQKLARWGAAGLRLHRVPFTELQLLLRKNVAAQNLTLQSRACMVQIAERLARKNRCSALISGEALNQVASQTVENLSYTNSFAELPVLRPLIGMDKEDIIRISRNIACFEISIEPHVDCCSYFAPDKPVTKANSPLLRRELSAVEGLEEAMQKCLAELETMTIHPDWNFPFVKRDARQS